MKDIYGVGLFSSPIITPWEMLAVTGFHRAHGDFILEVMAMKNNKAHQSKYWSQFVNLYRQAWNTNAGLEGASEFSDKRLKQCIDSFQMMLGLTREIDRLNGRVWK